MKKFCRITLVTFAWILPVMAFPSEPYGLYPHHRFADLSLRYYSGCFTPAPLCFAYASPADFFISTGTSYALGPHWKYWLIWVGLAIVLTSYTLRRIQPRTANAYDSCSADMKPVTDPFLNRPVAEKFQDVPADLRRSTTIFTTSSGKNCTTNWKMLSIGLILFLIVVCVGLFRSTLVLGGKYPRLTTDDFWSIVTTFSPAVFGFSILFWLECSIGKQTKAKKAVYWLAFALIAWGGWFIFPPDMLSASLLGGALWRFAEAIVLVAVVTWPIRYVAESLARRVKFLNDLEIYKMIQYSLIATWLLL